MYSTSSSFRISGEKGKGEAYETFLAEEHENEEAMIEVLISR
jgi:hypothetical protein